MSYIKSELACFYAHMQIMHLSVNSTLKFPTSYKLSDLIQGVIMLYHNCICPSCDHLCIPPITTYLSGVMLAF